MTGVRQWVRSRPIVALLVLVAVAIGIIWAYKTAQPQAPQRPLPPASASLRDVATAYLDAAVHQDCEMTRALTVPGDVFAWCTSPTMTAYRDLAGPAVLTAEQAGGQEEQCLSFEMTGSEAGAQVVAVGGPTVEPLPRQHPGRVARRQPGSGLRVGADASACGTQSSLRKWTSSESAVGTPCQRKISR